MRPVLREEPPLELGGLTDEERPPLDVSTVLDGPDQPRLYPLPETTRPPVVLGIGVTSTMTVRYG